MLKVKFFWGTTSAIKEKMGKTLWAGELDWSLFSYMKVPKRYCFEKKFNKLLLKLDIINLLKLDIINDCDQPHLQWQRQHYRIQKECWRGYWS